MEHFEKEHFSPQGLAFFSQNFAQPTAGGGAGDGKGLRHGSHAEHFEKEHLSPQGLLFFSQNFAQPAAGGGAGDGKG